MAIGPSPWENLFSKPKKEWGWNGDMYIYISYVYTCCTYIYRGYIYMLCIYICIYMYLCMYVGMKPIWGCSWENWVEEWS